MTYEEFVLLFLGGVSMMTLYIGVQAVTTGQRVYRYYALYSLCWIIYFYFRIFWRFNDPQTEAIVYPFGRISIPMLAYVFYYRFADSFLDLRRSLLTVSHLFRLTEFALLAYIFIELSVCLLQTPWTTVPAHEWVHTAVRLGVAAVSVYGMKKAWAQRNPFVNYFVMGSALLLFFGLLSMIFTFKTPNIPLLNWLWTDPIACLNIGILLELLCFSLGLSYKNNQTEIQKITIEQEVLREREQREMAQLKTQFFTNISHEFRTPLTLILGPLTDLLQKNPTNNLFQLMHRNASRLLALVNQLLDLSKLDAGQLQPNIHPGNLTEWLQLLTGSFSSLANDRDIHLLFSAETTAFNLAYFDRDKTEKIVTNLLANALKFTPAGGEVKVQLKASSDKQAVIQVRDTGIGIPADQQSRIFDRFHQVAGKPSTQPEGTGIGLTLVRELVTVLKGLVSVESQPGQGTLFTVTLPVDAHIWAGSVSKAERPFSTNEAESGVVPELDTDNLTEVVTNNSNQTDLPLLLIIDDNTDIRQYIRHVMDDRFQITEATDGQDGLRKATEQIPDLVICDWMMPQMDGMAFCQSLKTQPTTNHIPVIMLTAKASTANRIEGFGRGADDYLTKPFHPVELRVRVENLLSQRQKLRERYSRELYLKPADIQIASVDELFLQRAILVVERYMENSAFSVEQLADELHLSRMQLHRKLKALANQSATEFVRHVRLQRAANLLTARSATVSEVAFRVGFESLSYFSKSFKEQFGVLPSEYEGVNNSVT